MDAKTQADIIAAAVKHYGIENQLLKTVEELSELQRAIARVIEWYMETENEPEPPEMIENLAEETADAWIMVMQMTHIVGVDLAAETVAKKLRRLAERLGMQIGEDAP